ICWTVSLCGTSGGVLFYKGSFPVATNSAPPRERMFTDSPVAHSEALRIPRPWGELPEASSSAGSGCVRIVGCRSQHDRDNAEAILVEQSLLRQSCGQVGTAKHEHVSIPLALQLPYFGRRVAFD